MEDVKKKANWNSDDSRPALLNELQSKYFSHYTHINLL